MIKNFTKERYVVPGLARFHNLVLDWPRQCCAVCHLSCELDNSGAQFWLLDTDERAYKKDPLFRRCVNLRWRTINACVSGIGTGSP